MFPELVYCEHIGKRDRKSQLWPWQDKTFCKAELMWRAQNPTSEDMFNPTGFLVSSESLNCKSFSCFLVSGMWASMGWWVRLHYFYFCFCKMTLAAVSMDAQTVQRNGKRPREKTKTGDKRGNEKLRQGNWLTRNAYRWHNPHCFVHGCGSHGKRLKGRKYYNMHLFWALKCFKKTFFSCRIGNRFNWNRIWPEKLHICPDLDSHFFSLCMCACVRGFCRTLPCLHRSARRRHTKHVAKCSLCVFPLCVRIRNPLSVDRVPGCPGWL